MCVADLLYVCQALWVLFITQISTLIFMLYFAALSFLSSPPGLLLCVCACWNNVLFYSIVKRCCIVLYGFKGIIGKWWLHFFFFAFEPLITVCSVHATFFLIYSSSLFLILQLLSLLLFILFWLISLSLQFVKQKSFIYYTFPLEAMCVCVFLRMLVWV